METLAECIAYMQGAKRAAVCAQQAFLEARMRVVDHPEFMATRLPSFLHVSLLASGRLGRYVWDHTGHGKGRRWVMQVQLDGVRYHADVIWREGEPMGAGFQVPSLEHAPTCDQLWRECLAANVGDVPASLIAMTFWVWLRHDGCSPREYEQLYPASIVNEHKEDWVEDGKEKNE